MERTSRWVDPYYLLSAFLLIATKGSIAQEASFWKYIERPSIETRERWIAPTVHATVSLDVDAMEQWIDGRERSGDRDVVLRIPRPDGGSESFLITRTYVMHPDLGRRYPMIRTWSGIRSGDPGTTIHMDITPQGFHAMVLAVDGDSWFIDPYYREDRSVYAVYDRRNYQRSLPVDDQYCYYEQVNDLEQATQLTGEWIHEMRTQRAGDCQKRTYRLALACTGEYANYHGSNTSNNNKSLALAAMVTTMNRVNGMFERDAGLTMVMVPNNDALVFLNPATDPYTNNDTYGMLAENQTTCNNVIGAVDYDIGHVFATTGGGVATLNSPCTSSKARGVTGLWDPIGDPFDIDYVSHEMGHQFGAQHTQNNACGRSAGSAFEPGSGSTIMGYAGVCSPNVQSASDALFHGHSMVQIAANITVGSSSGCPQITSGSNVAPVVDAGGDRIIPKSTPFKLEATATDANAGDLLTYGWEQMDNEVSTQPPLPGNTNGPSFRTFAPVYSSHRYFPALDAVIANTTPTWEVLPSVARTMNFRVTVRDNVAGAGCNVQDDVVITVAGTAGPFIVTQPNTNVSWAAGGQQTVTWNVAGTNSSPVNCASVDILLSLNGGQSWPHILATATPNDGSQVVTLPQVAATTTARVMVKATGNVFYDISDQNFSITAGSPGLSVNAGVFLNGPFDTSIGRMQDHLRQAGLVPLTEPYTGLGFAQSGGGGETTTAQVLAVSGANAIVDWVRLELRSATNPSQIVATRQALLQSDGDIVDVNGTSPVTFNVAPGNYHLAVRHRNHLGCMTAAPVNFSSGSATVDLRSGSISVYGTDARKTIGNVRALWAGNAHRDDRLAYTGQNNDRDKILQKLGGLIPTAMIAGYHMEDANLDGLVKYSGSANDRDIILVNIGGVVPTMLRTEQLP